MKIRKYYVQNMQEGMRLIRNELGLEAVIVQSRKVRLKGLKGFFSPPQVEITAAVHNSTPKEQLDKNNFENEFRNELEDLKRVVNNLASRDAVPELEKKNEKAELIRWREKLQQQDIMEELVEEFMTEIQGSLQGEGQLTDEMIGLVLKKQLRKRLKTAPEKGSAVQVFVGPTGVGKTTTLAKLAARYALYQGEKVGIITIDHYRIGAVEQLRTYADITGLSLEVVLTPKELYQALERLSGCQRILIDTAGRSTLNHVHINELAGYMKSLPPAEIFLVTSTTLKAKDIKLVTDNFRCLGYNRLIFTKLDETNTYGTILNGIYLTDLPAIYLTTGQNVPDDINLADLDKMSALILGEEE